MPGVRYPWRNVPEQTPGTTTPPGEPLTEYLQRLNDRRDAALLAEDAARVADCEDRLIRCEVFLARLTSWQDGRDCWSPGASSGSG